MRWALRGCRVGPAHGVGPVPWGDGQGRASQGLMVWSAIPWAPPHDGAMWNSSVQLRASGNCLPAEGCGRRPRGSQGTKGTLGWPHTVDAGKAPPEERGGCGPSGTLQRDPWRWGLRPDMVRGMWGHERGQEGAPGGRVTISTEMGVG